MLSLYIALLLSPIIALFSGLALVPILLIITCCISYKNYQQISLTLSSISLKNQSKLNFSYKLFFFTTVYLLFSASLSISPYNSLISALKIISIFLIAVGCTKLAPSLDKKNYQRLSALLLLAIMTAAAVALFDMSSEGLLTSLFRMYKDGYIFSLSELNRGAVYLSLCLWPLAYFLYTRKLYWVTATTIVVICYTVFSLESLTASLALIASLLTFSGCWVLRKKMIHIISALLVLGVITTPVIATQMDPTELSNNQFKNSEGSIKHRLFIWSFAAKKAMEKPILGWGFDSARIIPVGENDKIPDCWGDKTKVTIACQWTDETRPYILPLHPHNGTLQIWLELGVVGLLLYIIIIAYTGFRIANTDLDPIKKYAFFSIFVQFIALQQTGFGIWQNWLWAAGILVLLQLRMATMPPRLAVE